MDIETNTPAPTAPETLTTPAPASPSDSQPAPAAEPSAEPAAEPAANAEADALAAARAVKPEAADGYVLTVGEAAKTILGDSLATDPAIAAIRETALAEGWTQGEFADRMALIDVLASKGLLEPAFNPAAEQALLGENGVARQQEQMTFLEALKTRGDLSDEEFGELSLLVPTAAGTMALEKIRKMMGPGGEVTAPDAAAQAASSQIEEAQALRRDPRYDSDRAFRKDADAKWMAAYNG